MSASWRLHHSPTGAPTRRVSAERLTVERAALVRAVAGAVRGGLDEDALDAVMGWAGGTGRPPSSWLGWRFQRDLVGLRPVRFFCRDDRLAWTGAWSPVAVTVGMCWACGTAGALRAAVRDGLVGGPVAHAGPVPLGWARSVLSVGTGADRMAIQRAFRAAVRGAHPDTGARAGVDIAALVTARDALLGELVGDGAGLAGGGRRAR